MYDKFYFEKEVEEVNQRTDKKALPALFGAAISSVPKVTPTTLCGADRKCSSDRNRMRALRW